MTTEHRLRFDLTDLTGVAIECVACGSSVEVPFAAINPADPAIGHTRIPDHCPRCGGTWEPPPDRTAEAAFLFGLSEFLRRLGDPDRTPRVRIRLELDAP